MNKIMELKGVHVGQTAYIVGSGPSLQYLEADNFGDGIVVALNDTILKVEQLGIPNKTYSMQKDGCLVCRRKCPPCWTVKPQKATLLVHKQESAWRLQEYAPRYVFSNKEDFNIPWFTFSSVVAIHIVALMGCNRIVLVSHDAMATGDTGRWSVRNHDDLSNKSNEGYLEQAKTEMLIVLNSKSIEFEFLTPKNKKG